MVRMAYVQPFIVQTYNFNKKYLLKKIYDEVIEDIFGMSNVRIFKEIEKDVYTWLWLRSAELSKAFGLRNLCYSKISIVMFLGCRIAGISRKLESQQKKPCAQMLHI